MSSRCLLLHESLESCSHSIDSVRVFLFLGDFGGVVLWLVGLVWLNCDICMENAVSKAWRNHDFSRCACDL